MRPPFCLPVLILVMIAGMPSAALQRPPLRVQSYRGMEAETRIVERLSGHAEAQKLAREVITFYGDAFIYREDPSQVSSQSVVWVPADTLEFEYASITLDSDSGRETEALAHEILHLSHVMRGQPFEAIFPPDSDSDFRNYWGSRNSIAGAVQHEMFVDEFVKLGFDRSKFLTRIGSPDYETLATRHNALIRLNPLLAAQTSVVWSEMYLLFWMAARHGYDQAQAIAEETLTWGTRVHAELPDMVPQLRQWVLDGRFRDFERYPAELNDLYQLMKIPRATSWVVLKASQSGPAVFR
jgi:hypothetical protein